ncbi:MAG: hypothetical protein IPM53_20900 [Anaerolineaceae bacterium]|nr:hypothetical protein [Anaerolineaceae bacterium]
MTNNSTTYLVQLHRLLNDHFNVAELQDLCFRLHIDYESIPGNEKSSRVSALLLRFARSRQLPKLITLVQLLRPHVNWPMMPDDFQLPESLHPNSFGTPTNQYHVYGDIVHGDKIVNEGLTTDGAADLPRRKHSVPWQHLLMPKIHPFIGRDTIVAQVTEQLRPGNVVTLWGAGGQGKSAIASHVLVKMAENGSLAERFPDGTILHTFSHQAGYDEALSHIIQSLGESFTDFLFGGFQRTVIDKQALIILESTEEITPNEIKGLTDSLGRCGMLITTRRQTDAANRSYLHRVNKFELSNALELFASIVNVTPEDMKDAARLCFLVDGLPLAIRVAASYILESAESITEYVTWLEEDTIGAVSSDDLMARMLSRSYMQLMPKTQEMFVSAAFLALRSFGEQTLMGILGWSLTDFKRARKQLIDYSLIYLVQEKQLRFTHMLIYEYARTIKRDYSEIVTKLTNYFRHLFDGDDLDEYPTEIVIETQINLLAILRRFAILQKWMATDLLVRGLSGSTDSLMWRLGALQMETEIAHLGLSAARHLSNVHAERTYLTYLGHIYQQRGMLQASIRFFEQAEDIAAKSGDTTAQQYLLEKIGHNQKAFDQNAAILRFRAALAIAVEQGDIIKQIQYYCEIGGLYFGQKKVTASHESFVLAVQAIRSLTNRAEQHKPLVLLANTMRKLGLRNTAILLYQEVLVIAEEFDDSQSISMYAKVIGDICASVCDLDRAIAMYEIALAAEQTQPERPSVLATHYRAIGNIYSACDKPHDAIIAFEKALNMENDPVHRIELQQTLVNLCEVTNDAERAKHYKEIIQPTLDEIIEKLEISRHIETQQSSQPLLPTGNESSRFEWANRQTGFTNPLDNPFLARKNVVILVNGRNVYGEKIYCYLNIPLEFYPTIRAYLESGLEFNLRDYGEVVAAGKGEPSLAVRAEMTKNYNMIQIENADSKANPQLIQPNSTKELIEAPDDGILYKKILVALGVTDNLP